VLTTAIPVRRRHRSASFNQVARCPCTQWQERLRRFVWWVSGIWCCLVLQTARPVAAQNIIGTWQMDPGRSKLDDVLRPYTSTVDHRLTVMLDGNAVVLDAQTTGIPSLDRVSFTMVFGTFFPPPPPAERERLDQTFTVTLRFECDGLPHAIPVGDVMPPDLNTYVCRRAADWSAYTIDEELRGIHRITRVSTSPDGDALKIDTTQTHHDAMLRIFLRTR
jgi:hypothetical protein